MNVKLHDVHFKQYTSFFDNVQQSRLTHQKWGIHHRYIDSSFEHKPCKVWSGVLLLCHSLYPHSHELRKQESAVKILVSRWINSSSSVSLTREGQVWQQRGQQEQRDDGHEDNQCVLTDNTLYKQMCGWRHWVCGKYFSNQLPEHHEITPNDLEQIQVSCRQTTWTLNNYKA